MLTSWRPVTWPSVGSSCRPTYRDVGSPVRLRTVAPTTILFPPRCRSSRQLQVVVELGCALCASRAVALCRLFHSVRFLFGARLAHHRKYTRSLSRCNYLLFCISSLCQAKFFRFIEVALCNDHSSRPGRLGEGKSAFLHCISIRRGKWVFGFRFEQRRELPKVEGPARLSSGNTTATRRCQQQLSSPLLLSMLQTALLLLSAGNAGGEVATNPSG